jgi:hypothetical protein
MILGQTPSILVYIIKGIHLTHVAFLCCRLKKLQLGKNRLTKLDLMSCVTNLTQLSVEDNELSTLSGIEPLVNLMELYAGKCGDVQWVQMPPVAVIMITGKAKLP